MGMQPRVYVGAFLAIQGLSDEIYQLGDVRDEIENAWIKVELEDKVAMIPNVDKSDSGEIRDMETLPTFIDVVCPCSVNKKIRAFMGEYHDLMSVVEDLSEGCGVVFGTIGYCS